MSRQNNVKIWLHLIWCTARCERFFAGFDQQVFVSKKLYEISRAEQIFMRMNTVMCDHIHALIALPPARSIDHIIALYKTSLLVAVSEDVPCQWGEGYTALSVSASQVDPLLRYFADQRAYHRRESYRYELALFYRLYKIG